MAGYLRTVSACSLPSYLSSWNLKVYAGLLSVFRRLFVRWNFYFVHLRIFLFLHSVLVLAWFGLCSCSHTKTLQYFYLVKPILQYDRRLPHVSYFQNWRRLFSFSSQVWPINYRLVFDAGWEASIYNYHPSNQYRGHSSICFHSLPHNLSCFSNT